MAKQRNGIDVGFIAGHALTGNQYYFVKAIAADTVSTVNAITDTIIGVLQNKPESGSGALVRVLGHSKVISGYDGLAYGDMVAYTANGTATAAAADAITGTAGAVVMSAASSGSVAEVLLFGPSASN